MRRGPGPPDSSAEPSPSSVLVNQSQGFDTTAFVAPQPSACEVSPKPPRRRTSGGGTDARGRSGSSESSLRRSLELDRQQDTGTFLPFSRGEDSRGKSSSGPINMQQPQPHHQQMQYPLHQPQLLHHQHQHQHQQSPPIGPTSPVRRTRSLKENLIKRFNSSVAGGAVGIARAAGVAVATPHQQQPSQSPKAAPEESPTAVGAGEEVFAFDLIHVALAARAAGTGGSRSSSPMKAQEAAAARQSQQQQQQQQQQPTPMSRNRAGSLRSGSVVKVLPDKKLLNKASSSENLTQNAAAADLSSLASLVQKKRDRSQESLEQGRPAAGGSSGGAGVRKPPTPTPAADSDDGSEVAAASASATSKSKPPSGIVRSARKLESPTGRSSAATVAPVAAVGATAAATTDDSPAEANDTDRESPGEDQQSDGEVPSIAAAGGGVSAGGHNRSNSLEFLMQDAQSRTAPQIRHPSARKIEAPPAAYATAAAVTAATAIASARREASPPKPLASGGSSPPKAVSFNPKDEIKTYEGDYSSGRYRKHHRGPSSQQQQPQQQQRHRRPQDNDRNGHSVAWSQGKIGDNALIEVHSAMVESMDKMVSKQRQFLSQVKDGSITVGEYREVMKSLLTMQTKTIHQILDAIQSNEKPS